MLRSTLAALILVASAWAQSAQQTTPATKRPAPPSKTTTEVGSTKTKTNTATTGSTVAPETPVVTVQGLCNQPAGAISTNTKPASSDCKIAITRAEFEKVINAIQPEMPAAARKQFADRYAMGLVLAHKAHEAGLDRTANFEEMMKLMRIQVLAQEFAKQMRDKASKISDKQVEDYYNQNSSSFQEANLDRIFIPKTKQPAESDSKSDANTSSEKQKQADSAAEMKIEADSIHTRAAAGEDFGKLQTEALEKAEMKIEAPSTKLGKIRRSSLPPDQVSVFDLKPGTISDLIDTPNGYFIYKLESKNTLPLAEVKEEIRGNLQNEELQNSMEAIQHSVQLSYDDSYFKTSGPPAARAPMGNPGSAATQGPAPK